MLPTCMHITKETKSDVSKNFLCWQSHSNIWILLWKQILAWALCLSCYPPVCISSKINTSCQTIHFTRETDMSNISFEFIMLPTCMHITKEWDSDVSICSNFLFNFLLKCMHFTSVICNYVIRLTSTFIQKKKNNMGTLWQPSAGWWKTCLVIC